MAPVNDLIKEKLKSIKDLPKGAADVLKESILDGLTGGGKKDIPKKKKEPKRRPKDDDKELKTRREILKDPILKALSAITKESFSAPEQWLRWWDAREKE